MGLSFLIFVGSLMVGFGLANKKPLWGDEIRSQAVSVERLTPRQIISGRFIGRSEGNVSPLFYLIQKGISALFDYKYSGRLEEGFQDLKGQVLLRVSPNIFMALSASMIFYFFSRYYSLWTGCYSLFLFFSSFMVWVYWAEARPYAQWLWGTTAQSLFFLRILEKGKMNSRIWIGITATHFILSLTIIFSLVQIAIVTLLLWLRGERDYKKHFLSAALPGVVCLYYFFHAPQYKYLFKTSPLELIDSNFPMELCFVILFYAVWRIGSLIAGRKKRESSDTACFFEKDRAGLRSGMFYLAFTVLMVLAAFAVSASFMVFAREGEVYAVSERYFIYLTPVGIISATFFSDRLVKGFQKQRWMLVNVFMSLGGLMVIRFIKIVMNLHLLGLFL